MKKTKETVQLGCHSLYSNQNICHISELQVQQLEVLGLLMEVSLTKKKRDGLIGLLFIVFE